MMVHMKTLKEIYSAYKIMPTLQTHQMRVAAVVKYITDNLKVPVDTDTVIKAALFHDMGNIIKSDLPLFPKFVEPEGFAYWEKVKKEYIEKYGEDEHAATIAIAREIGLSKRVTELISNIGFGKMAKIRDENDLEGQILEYADMRVLPHGIASTAERIREGSARYVGKKGGFSAPEYEKLFEALGQIENNIVKRSGIKPEDITDESVKTTLENFQNYRIVVN